jgi:hypothetical protein
MKVASLYRRFRVPRWAAQRATHAGTLLAQERAGSYQGLIHNRLPVHPPARECPARNSVCLPPGTAFAKRELVKRPLTYPERRFIKRISTESRSNWSNAQRRIRNGLWPNESERSQGALNRVTRNRVSQRPMAAHAPGVSGKSVSRRRDGRLHPHALG